MEYTINLEALVKMKRVFEEADEDGSGELDIDEFTAKLGPHLGQHLSDAQIAQLFLKIDADCGGTIDWDEFTNFFFLQRGVANAAEDQQFRLYPKATWRKEWKGEVHREPVLRLYSCAPLEKYITCSKDGAFRVWNQRDLAAPVQTVQNSGAWVNDVAYLEGQRKLLVAAMDRTLTYYDVMRHSFEYCGRVAATGQMGSPSCLAVLDGGSDPRIFYGDTTGAVVRLRCGPPVPHSAPRPLGPKDFEVLHQAHSDWVTQLLDIPDVGLLSSSLDATVRILELGRGLVANTFSLHRKPVRSLAYSRAFSLVASAGPERSVLLWPPKGNINRKIGELAGHSAGVVQVVMADARSQAITLSEDNVIRVFDLRNHGCIQTINRADWAHAEDSRPEALLYDVRQDRLLSALHRPALWEHRAVQSDKGHSGRLCCALYNSAFHVVVSGDQSGTIFMWNAQNGQCEGGFTFNGGSGQKLTALAFDTNQRRLLTASEAGELKMWNFNSGAVLREYRHHEGRKEITAVAFLAPGGLGGEGGGTGSVSEHSGGESDSEVEEGPPSLVLATGWSRNVCIWEDSDGHEVTNYRTLEAHEADVLSMACWEGRLVATGDFEGGIKVWDLASGCCAASVSYGGAQWERAVDKLAFLRAAGGQLLLLACGPDGMLKLWRLDLVDAGGSGGEGGSNSPPRGEGAATAEGGAAQRLGAPADGSGATFLAQLRGVQRPRDRITALAVDDAGGRLVTADSSGHVHVWDASSIDVSSGEGAAGSLRLLGQWRAREAAIVSLQPLPQHGLLLLASDDSTVSLWTPQGGLVGVFGQHTWDLDSRSSWQDPAGAAALRPLSGASEGLTPREIIARTPRRTTWDLEPALSPRKQAVSMGAAAAAVWAVGSCPQPSPRQGRAAIAPAGGPSAAAQLQRLALAAIPHDAVVEQQEQGLHEQEHGGPAGAGGEPSSGGGEGGSEQEGPSVSPAAAGRLLAEAAQASRAGRDNWRIPLSVQAHGALALHATATVPTDAFQIWGTIKGYSGAGRERRSVKASKAAGFASSKQRTSEVQAILQKTAPAFGRSAASQHLSLLLPEHPPA